VTPLLIALGSSLAGAVGFVLQQHSAASEPPGSVGLARLLAHLVRRPLWVAGVAAMVAGQLLSATALAKGGLTLVEPSFATMLLFALVLYSVWHRRRPGPREWVGALVLSGGVAGFVLAAHPGRGGPPPDGMGAWAPAGGAIAATIAGLVLAARRSSAGVAATLLGTAAGTLFGTQDALTRRSLLILAGGTAALLQTWSGYLLVVVAVVAIALAQRAFQLAPLPASLPAINIAEPLTGIAIGAGVDAEHVEMGAAALAVEVISLAAMAVGLFLVARSPMGAGRPSGGPGERR
jgi:drug/metabolite transporter (DMT)-like permease